MTHRNSLALIVGCLLTVACSSSTESPPPVVDSGKETAADTGTPPADTTPETTTETGSPDDACGKATSMMECQKCCSTNHADAYKAFATALLTCGCKAGNCDKDCAATACAATPASPDATCNTCLTNIQGTSCKADLTAACTGTGPCAPFNLCVTDYCAGKK